MLIAGIIFVAIFILMGILLWTGQGLLFFLGFRTMSKEDQKTHDIKSLGRFLGIIFWVLSIGLGLMFFSDLWGSAVFFYLGLGLFTGTFVFAIFYANTGDRFMESE